MAITNVRLAQDPRWSDNWYLALDTASGEWGSIPLTVELAEQIRNACNAWLEEESQRGMMASFGINTQQGKEDS